MKLIEVPIGGQRYYARFSTRILVALEERNAANGGSGDPQEELNAIMASGKMSALFWLLAQMLEAGRKAAEMEGLTPPPAITWTRPAWRTMTRCSLWCPRPSTPTARPPFRLNRQKTGKPRRSSNFGVASLVWSPDRADPDGDPDHPRG